MYSGVNGIVWVYDEIGTLGKTHTSPTIAVPPGGLSSLYFEDSVHADPDSGYKTLPYDPGVPTSCVSFEFQHTGPTKLTTHTFSGDKKITEPVNVAMLSSNQMFLAPPIQLLTLDPAWRNCEWITDGADHAGLCM